MSNSTVFIDVSTLPDNGYGFFQLMFITLVYVYLLFIGANMISEGSELLLLVPSLSGIVGSIVLPVLGAVPDAAIVLFSGLGSDPQYQLEVGIGALAGSTIMLITIPWFLIIIAGRVDIDSNTGKARYTPPKLSPPNKLNLYTTGVAVSQSCKNTAYVLMITSVSYYVIEGAALAYRNVSDDQISTYEFPYAIAAFLLCMILLSAYLWLAYSASNSDDAVVERDEYLTEGIKSGSISLVAVVKAVIPETPTGEPSEQTGLLTADDKAIKRLKMILKPFFDKFDADGSKSIDSGELTLVLKDLGENLQSPFIKKIIAENFQTGKGSLSYDEFIAFCLKYASEQPKQEAKQSQSKPITTVSSVESGNDEEEKEDVPEDLVSLTPEEQQTQIKMRSAWMLLVGTVIVLIFSDALVPCLAEIGTRMGIRPFYVAFILAPFISNGSELVASFNYASKKTSKSIDISMATLLGAATMNNTLVLAVFNILIFWKGLYYEFFAETCAILLVEYLICMYTIFKSVHTVLDAFIILSFYPLSLVLVYFLYTIGWG